MNTNLNFNDELTSKQQRFCDEYLIDRNACRAALRAGYKQGTAMNGSLMGIPKIKKYLDERMGAVAAELKINQELVLAELGKIAFANLSNFFDDDGKVRPLSELSSDDFAAVHSITISKDGSVKIVMNNKLSALDKIARHLNFYKRGNKDFTDVGKDDFTDIKKSDFTDVVVDDSTDLVEDNEFDDEGFWAEEEDESGPGEFEPGFILRDGAGIAYAPEIMQAEAVTKCRLDEVYATNDDGALAVFEDVFVEGMVNLEVWEQKKEKILAVMAAQGKVLGR